jgi:hypothetical protein
LGILGLSLGSELLQFSCPSLSWLSYPEFTAKQDHSQLVDQRPLRIQRRNP